MRALICIPRFSGGTLFPDAKPWGARAEGAAARGVAARFLHRITLCLAVRVPAIRQVPFSLAGHERLCSFESGRGPSSAAITGGRGAAVAPVRACRAGRSGTPPPKIQEQPCRGAWRALEHALRRQTCRGRVCRLARHSFAGLYSTTARRRGCCICTVQSPLV